MDNSQRRIIRHREERQKKIAQALKRKGSYSANRWGMTSVQIRKLIEEQKSNHQKVVREKQPIKKRDPPPVKFVKTIPEDYSIVFFTASIGDFFAVESFFSKEIRENIHTFLYATRKEKTIRELVSTLPNYPNLKSQESVWGDFRTFWCFLSKENCMGKFKEENLKVPNELKKSIDCSIEKIFPIIKNKQLKFSGSSFLEYQLTNINDLSTPSDYYLICPYSTDKVMKDRDFTQKDWESCIKRLTKENIQGVVLHTGEEFIPKSKYIVNLCNKTNIKEAIEITKRAKGYIGIDSCLSVIAAQIFQPPHILIKSVNPHLYNNLECYYPMIAKDPRCFGRTIR